LRIFKRSLRECSSFEAKSRSDRRIYPSILQRVALRNSFGPGVWLRPMSRRSHSFIALSMYAGLGCGQADDGPVLGSTEQPIVYGAPSEDAENSVVFVLMSSPNNQASCTGTMVAPNLMATALHCVTSKEAAFFSCLPDGTVNPATPGDGTLGTLVTPSSVKIYAGSKTEIGEPTAVGARIFGTGSSQVCRNDLALVQLDRDLDLPLAPMRLDGRIKWGEKVRALGFGQTETERNDDGLRYGRDDMTIVDVGPTSDGEETRTAAPRTFVVDEGPCHGDSGGPAFAQETGALLGVYSLSGAKSCTQIGIRNVYTSLIPFSELILSAFEAAGHEPILEEGSTPPSSGSSDSGGCTLAPSRSPASPLAGCGVALGLAASILAARRRRSPG
jgi:hypothetical protein